MVYRTTRSYNASRAGSVRNTQSIVNTQIFSVKNTQVISIKNNSRNIDLRNFDNDLLTKSEKKNVNNTLNENDLQQELIEHSEPYTLYEKLVIWTLFICTVWLNFGCGYSWSSNFATEKQTTMYYKISGYKYRVLNEIFLYVYTVYGHVGTYLSGKNLKLNMILACVLLSSGSIMIYLSENNYWFYFAGNAVLSLSQAHLFAASPTIADRYFPVS